MNKFLVGLFIVFSTVCGGYAQSSDIDNINREDAWKASPDYCPSARICSVIMEKNEKAFFIFYFPSGYKWETDTVVKVLEENGFGAYNKINLPQKRSLTVYLYEHKLLFFINWFTDDGDGNKHFYATKKELDSATNDYVEHSQHLKESIN
jgi:hypothetical protein